MKTLFLYLANLKLAIIILLTLALSSSFGSIIEQNKDFQFYQQNYNFFILGVPFYKFIKVLSLDNIYTSFWFISLLILLSISLLSCTFFQQLPTLNFSRRYYFYKQPNQFNRLFFKAESTRVVKSKLIFNLFAKNYSIFFQKNCVYAYKGLISKLGPIIVHFSLICILVGSCASSIKGFTSQELIPKSEVFHIQNIIKTGVFAYVPQENFRINDFWSLYNKKGDVKQFYSDISILDSKGVEIKRKTISVNNPLLFKELSLYQSDWSILGFRLEIGKLQSSSTIRIVQIPVLKVNQGNSKLWISSFNVEKKNSENSILLLRNNRGQLSIFNTKGQFIETQNLGEINSNKNVNQINLIEILPSTGIQIKSDPGLKLIYIGFFVLIISSLISYLSFSEVWLLSTTKNVILGARTNRSKINLRIEMLNLQRFLFN
ncbi:unnamed protein product [Dictyota dichotoma]